jgi:signal peptidase I
MQVDNLPVPTMNPIGLLPPRLRAGAEIVLTLLMAVLIAYVAQAYVVKPYRVPTVSMVPTLEPGDRVIADRLSLDFRDPSRGEIVVFQPPYCVQGENSQGVCDTSDRTRRVGPASDTFIKRVIGLPGELIWAKAGHVWVKPAGGKPTELVEPYLHGTRTASFPQTLVPAGCFFMMGDNRADSLDSRKWGCEPRSDMIGIARLRYWPVDRLGIL